VLQNVVISPTQRCTDITFYPYPFVISVFVYFHSRYLYSMHAVTGATHWQQYDLVPMHSKQIANYRVVADCNACEICSASCISIRTVSQSFDDIRNIFIRVISQIDIHICKNRGCPQVSICALMSVHLWSYFVQLFV